MNDSSRVIQENEKIKVCVIGSGAAGLCAARHLAANSNRFEFTVFERQSEIGGTWIYTDKIDLDDDGLPIFSSMYKNLRTNLPKEIMTFPDFPEFKGDEEKSYVSHQFVLDYLKNYCKHFHLHNYVKFHTIVQSVKLKKIDIKMNVDKWEVQVKNTKSLCIENLIFDAVIICNGHNSVPYVSKIPGIEDFQGQTIHSHSYRKPEDFVGKKIILLGAGSSGSDLASELSKTASRVYLSHNKERLGANNQSLNFTEVAGIEKYSNGKFILKDDKNVEADVLIFCTGYQYQFPFLHENCGVKVDKDFITPLYQYIVNVNHPTMAFIGLPLIVLPFPLFHYQVKYFVATLLDKNLLPSHRYMIENSIKVTSKGRRDAFTLGKAQWCYINDLVEAGKFEPLPAYYKIGYEMSTENRKKSLKNYRNFNFIVKKDEKDVTIVESFLKNHI